MRGNAGVMDNHHLGEVLKTFARKLGERCGSAAVDMLARRLTEYIGSAEDDRYSYIWRSAIEEHEQDAHKKDTRAVLVDAVRDAALGATSAASSEALTITTSLLQSGYPILVRVGIYICGEHYGTVGSAFWICAKQNWFIDISYWHEIYWFIKKCFAKFSAAERDRFLEFVDQLEGDWSDETRREEWDETYRRDLLHPAFGQGDSEIDDKYQALVKRWGPMRDHPDFHYHIAVGWVGEQSPIASDTLVSMSDPELMDFLKGFMPDNQNRDGPTYRGAASSISAAVRASEDGFARRIRLFADLARPYQHGLLRGLKERWHDDKRDIDWSTTISVLHTIVFAPEFEADLKADKSEGWEPSIQWVISDIADLLKAAFRIERHLPTELYKPCLEILCHILQVTDPAEAGKSDDAVSYAINSTRGRTLESFIHLALAMRREEVAANPDSCDTWTEIGPVFDAELESSESGLNAEFATLAGIYCANFHYINARWTETNFDRLFSSSNEAAWSCAAQGFAYQHYMYDWLFVKLLAGGHLRRMIYSDELPDRVIEKALQFLGLAYIEGKENLEGGGLLCELIASLRVEMLSRICWFFWTLRGTEESSPRESKVLKFWLKVAEQIRSSQTEMPELQSALCQLVTFIQKFTSEIVTALTEAAPHAQVSHHGHLLMEHLARLVDKYPKQTATVFRAALSGFLPDYDPADVIRCVKGLADAGEIEDAEGICNAYINRGSTLLKETYKSLRAEQRSRFQTGGSTV